LKEGEDLPISQAVFLDKSLLRGGRRSGRLRSGRFRGVGFPAFPRGGVMTQKCCRGLQEVAIAFGAKLG
jgi:hypothetical protein